MPLRITQQECSSDESSARRNRGKTEKTDEVESLEIVLKVQGSLYLEDAVLLEKICRDIRTENESHLTLDLADLAFLDSESASVLCRLKREQNVALEGLHLFIQKVIELTEAQAKVADYLPEVSR